MRRVAVLAAILIAPGCQLMIHLDDIHAKAVDGSVPSVDGSAPGLDASLPAADGSVIPDGSLSEPGLDASVPPDGSLPISGLDASVLFDGSLPLPGPDASAPGLDAGPITICPSAGHFYAGETTRFSAIVSGFSDYSLTWSSTCGATFDYGTFSDAGTTNEMAEATIPSGAGTQTCTVTATDSISGSSGTATIDISLAPPSLSGTVTNNTPQTGRLYVMTTDHGGGVFTRPEIAPGAIVPFAIFGVDGTASATATVRAFIDVLGTGQYSYGADPVGEVAFQYLTATSTWKSTSADPVGIGPPPAPIGTASFSGQALVASNGEATPSYLVFLPRYEDSTNTEVAAYYVVNVSSSPAVKVRAGVQSIAYLGETSFPSSITAFNSGGQTLAKLSGTGINPQPPPTTSGTIVLTVTDPGGHGGNLIGFALADPVAPTAIYFNEVAVAAGDTSAQTVTITVDASLVKNNYFVAAFLDVNKDGEIGPNDLSTLTAGPPSILASLTTGGTAAAALTFAQGPLVASIMTNHTFDASHPAPADSYSWGPVVAPNGAIPVRARYLQTGTSPVELGLQDVEGAAFATQLDLGHLASPPTLPTVAIEAEVDGQCDLAILTPPPGIILGSDKVPSCSAAQTASSLTLSWAPAAWSPNNYEFSFDGPFGMSAGPKVSDFGPDTTLQTLSNLAFGDYTWSIIASDGLGHSVTSRQVFTLFSATSPANVPADNLHGVWGTASGDAWVVGDNGKIWNFDAAAFDAQTSPTGNPLFAVSGSGDNDIWAVGDVMAVHKSGSGWSVDDPSSALAGMSLTSVTASDPSSIWAVGSTKSGSHNGVAFGWDATNSKWLPASLGTVGALSGVWSSTPGDVWAVGAAGTILHGTTGSSGTGWSPSNSPSAADLNGVWGTSPLDMFAVGAQGTILHWDGSNWFVLPSGILQGTNLNAIAGGAGDGLWAVGSAGSSGGVVYHLNRFSNGLWSAIIVPSIGDLNAIWRSPSGDYFLVGNGAFLILSTE